MPSTTGIVIRYTEVYLRCGRATAESSYVFGKDAGPRGPTQLV